MAVRRGVLSVVVSLTLLLALAVSAPSANAVSLKKVSGGKSMLYVPFQNLQRIGAAGIFIGPISPAYLSFKSFVEGPALNLPISGGAVERHTMLGTVDHQGGMVMQKIDSYDRSVDAELRVTVPRIVNGNTLVGNALDLVPSPTADLVNATHSFDPATGVIHYEADARIGAVTATVLNIYFSTDAFEGNMPLGRIKSDIQTQGLL